MCIYIYCLLFIQKYRTGKTAACSLIHFNPSSYLIALVPYTNLKSSPHSLNKAPWAPSILKAMNYSADCLQSSLYADLDGETSLKDEDCLYLNIWYQKKPDLPTSFSMYMIYIFTYILLLMKNIPPLSLSLTSQVSCETKGFVSTSCFVFHARWSLSAR